MSLRTIVIIGWVVVIGYTSPASAQSASDHRLVVSANAGIQGHSSSRTDVVQFDLNREIGEIRASQALGPYLVFDGGGSVRIWKRLGFGLSVSHVRGAATAAIEADVPHPFFFEFDRTPTGSLDGLRHREIAYHVNGQFRVPLSTTSLLTLSGGPSYFDASQDLVAAIGTRERGFPFDQVDIVSTRVERVSVTAWGYNVGLDLAYWGPRLNILRRLGLPHRVGVGVGLRYSRAKPDVELRGIQQARALQVGLVHAVGGVRVGF